jgi:hypothetical protein
MDGFDSKLCLREFWECLDENQRDSLLKVNIKDEDDSVQCAACRPCYKAAVLALKEKANETRFEGHANDSDRQTIWVTNLCDFLGVYSGQEAWEGHVVPSKFDTAAVNNDDDDWGEAAAAAATPVKSGNPQSSSAKNGGKAHGSGSSSSGGGDVEKFLRINGSTSVANNFALTNSLANDLVEHICVLFDPADKGRGNGGASGSNGGSNSGNSKSKGKKGKKGKKSKGKGSKGKKGSKNDQKTNSSSSNSTNSNSSAILQRNSLVSIFDRTTNGNPLLNDRGKPSKQCWYCQDKISLRFLDLLTYPRPVRKFKLLLDPSMTLKDLKILVGKEVRIEPDDVVLLKKGFGRVDGSKPGDYDLDAEKDALTIAECGLRWNKLIIISQVPMDLRKTKPTEAQSGQNRDEQNKQFVGTYFIFCLFIFLCIISF